MSTGRGSDEISDNELFNFDFSVNIVLYSSPQEQWMKKKFTLNNKE